MNFLFKYEMNTYINIWINIYINASIDFLINIWDQFLLLDGMLGDLLDEH